MGDPDFAEFKGPCSENKNQCALCIRNETEVEKICKISCQNGIAKCQEVMDDRQGGHWPKYGSSTLKLKRKIRKLEYQLEQEKMKNSNQMMQKSSKNSDDEELKNAKSKS